MALFQKALDVFGARNDDLVNKVLEIAGDGSVYIREWNAGAHDIGPINDPKQR